MFKTLYPLQLVARGVTPKFILMFIIIMLANVFSNEQYDM